MFDQAPQPAVLQSVSHSDECLAEQTFWFSVGRLKKCSRTRHWRRRPTWRQPCRWIPYFDLTVNNADVENLALVSVWSELATEWLSWSSRHDVIINTMTIVEVYVIQQQQPQRRHPTATGLRRDDVCRSGARTTQYYEITTPRRRAHNRPGDRVTLG